MAAGTLSDFVRCFLPQEDRPAFRRRGSTTRNRFHDPCRYIRRSAWLAFQRLLALCQLSGVVFYRVDSTDQQAAALQIMLPAMSPTRQSREVDRRAIAECGMSGLVLMENAGRGTADVLCQLAETEPGGHLGPVLVCCGKGNNAGDGFVIARHLDLRGHEVRVLVWAEPAELTGDAGANFQILRHTGVPIELLGSRHDAARLADALAGAIGWSTPYWVPAPAANLVRRWMR